MTLTEQDVRAIAERQLAEMKPFIKDGVLAPNDKGEYPAPWVGFKEAWEQRRELAVHILNGEFPEHLFRNRAPNQTEAELEWLRKNFKQTTLPVFLDLENTVGRAMHPRNWSVEFVEDATGEDVREYTEKGIREWGSVYNFMRFAGLRIKIQDAMGIVAVLPTNVAVIEEEDGTQRMDPDAVMEPDIHYFTCEQLWGYEYDKWYLLRLNTNSYVDWYNGKKQTGVLCWLVDGENVWRIEQVGRPSDWRFDISLEFRHGIGFAPCINLMGTPAVKQGRLVWESPYLAPKDLLDIALMNANYLEASMQTVMYPHKVMIGDPCDFVDVENDAPCVGGFITYYKEDRKFQVQCKQCGGTGDKGRLSRFGTLVVNRDPNSTSTDQVNATNALAFVSPETASLEFTSAHIEKITNAARAMLHLMPATNVAGAAGQTPNEVNANDRAKDAFVKTIADQLFLIHAFVVDCIGKMRHGADWDGFVLRPPTNYDLRTDSDHLEEIAAAMEKGLPPAIINSMIGEYVNSRYAGDPKALEVFSLLAKADRLQGMSTELIQAEAASNRVKPWEIFLHFAGLMIVDKLMLDQAFMNAEDDVRVGRIIAEAQAAAPVATAAPNRLVALASAVAA